MSSVVEALKRDRLMVLARGIREDVLVKAVCAIADVGVTVFESTFDHRHEDCIAEHFTTSTGSGAFAGVWNSRYGWYQPSDVIRGPSAYFHRHFIDALFRQELVELGLANQWSHERCAPMVNEECMRWCYYETNLFGDPMQRLGGSGAALLFDREAYKSSATAHVTYYAPDAPDDAAATVDVVFAVERRNWRAWTDEDCAVVSLPLVSPQTVSLAYVGESGDGRFLYEGEVSLADFAFDEKDPVLATRLNYEYVNALGEKTPRNAPRLLHDDVITVSLADGSAGSDTAVVDDVAPAFRDVRIRNAAGLPVKPFHTQLEVELG